MVASTKTFGKPKKKKDSFVAGGEPIVITGGSVILEFPNATNNKFEDDGPPPLNKRKLKNKSDRAELTFVRITDKSDNLLMEIDLHLLGIKKSCKVKVFYEIP